MYKFYCSFVVLLVTISCCHGWKVYFEHEDEWIDEEEVMRDAKHQRLQLIFPGTKWCGTGNVSESEDDLGSAAVTDACCREHDYCDDVIEAGETNHNLTNDSFYTKLNCKCDQRFYDCLKMSDSKSAKAIGNIYFNVLGTECYRYDYPIIRCIKFTSFTHRRCKEYEFNTDAPKKWQWFDVPKF